MAEPARQLHDYDDEPESLSARERANQRWGVGQNQPEESGNNIYDKEPEESGSARDRANERWGMSPDELKDQEESGSTPQESKADKTEGENLGKHENQIGDGFQDEKQGGLKRIAGRISGLSPRKKVIGGGIIGVGVGGAFFMFSTFSGYAQFMQLSNLLQKFHISNNEEFANDRTGRYLLHRVQTGRGHAKMQTRLGFRGNRIANKMELRLQSEAGVQSVYDTRTGNFKGFQIIGPEDRAINALIDSGIDPDTAVEIRPIDEFPNTANVDGNIGNGRIIAPKPGLSVRETIKIRRIIAKSITSTVGLNKIAAANGFRKTAVRGGLELHPIRRADAVLDEYRANKWAEFKKKLKDEWNKRIKNGAELPGDVTYKNTDDEGKPLPEAEEAQRAEAERAGNEAIDDAQKGDKVGARSRTAAKISAGAAVGIGTLCAARSISSNVEEIKHNNIILPMMRMGARAVSTGAQVAASFASPTGADLDVDQLGVMSEDLFDEARNLGWDSAASIQYELGEEPAGPDIPPTAKPSRATEKPAFLNIIDSIFDKIPGSGAACSRIGQFAIGTLTGGFISNIVEEVVGGLASAAGVNPMDAFVGWIVDTLAGDMVDVNAIGPDFGNIVNYGARLMANEQAIAMGGAKLDPGDVAILDAESKATQQREFQSKSLFAKMFDVTEPKSVLSKGIVENQRFATLQGAFGGSVTSFTNSFANFGSGFARLLTPSKVKAAATPTYEYSFDEYGYTFEEQIDEKYVDPYENARIVEQEIGLENLVGDDDYGKCSSTKINPDTGNIEGNEIARYDQIPDKCHNRNDENLARYRFYIADTMNLLSLECWEGDSNACAQLGIIDTSGPASGFAAGGGIGTAIDGFVFPLQTTKSVVINNDPKWCHTSQTNCHHDYNAADIFVPTGTVVVAAKPGTVIKERYSLTGRGHNVQIKGDDGNIYFYNHMSKDSPIRAGIRAGDRVAAGQPIGVVGTDQEAQGTPKHLHFDILPPPYQNRVSCSGAECSGIPFINVQPSLIAAFNNLPQ